MAFPIETTNNSVATEERLRALPVHPRAVVTEAIRQGAATALGYCLASDWHSGECLGGGARFFARLMDDDIVDLVENLSRPPTLS